MTPSDALAAPPRPQIVAYHGRTQPVEVRHHDTAFHASRNLVDESSQPGVTAQPENRYLRTQPRHIVEPAHSMCNGAWMRRVVEEDSRAFAIDVLEVSSRLAIGHH